MSTSLRKAGFVKSSFPVALENAQKFSGARWTVFRSAS